MRSRKRLATRRLMTEAEKKAEFERLVHFHTVMNMQVHNVSEEFARRCAVDLMTRRMDELEKTGTNALVTPGAPSWNTCRI